MVSPSEDVDAITGAAGHYDTVAVHIKRVVESSMTGKHNFKSAWLKATRAMFQATIMERIMKLEHLDFVEDELSTFKTSMIAQAASLHIMGHQTNRRNDIALELRTQKLVVVSESANDEWEFRLMARVKTVALNSGALQPLPWKSMLLKLGGIADTPRFTQVPDAMPAQCRAARKMAQLFLKEKKATTFHQMIATINSKADALRALDRSFECEIAFLNDFVESMAQVRIRKSALLCFPTKDKKCSLQQASKSIGSIKNSEMLRASGPVIAGEVDGVMSMLSDLTMGICPTDKDIERIRDFYTTVLKRSGVARTSTSWISFRWGMSQKGTDSW